MEQMMLVSIRIAVLLVWGFWILCYWDAGIGLVKNITRSFHSSMLFYDRYFIIGLVVLSNIILWTGYLQVTGRLQMLQAAYSVCFHLLGGIMVLIGAAGTFWCRRQMQASWSAHTALVGNHLVECPLRIGDDHPLYS